MPEPATQTLPTVTGPFPNGDPPAEGPAPTGTPVPDRPRRAVALVAESTLGPDGEMLPLLRRRLRQMVLLFLAAYAAFLLRDLLAPTRIGLQFQKAMFLAVTAVQLLLVGVAWSGWANSPTRLRAIELAVLVVFGVTVGSTQFDWLCNWDDLGNYVTGERATDGQVLVANTWVIPWFALIVGYPAVVPNPFRRALVIAGSMALLPVLVTAAAIVASPRLGWAETRMMFVQYAIWLPLGVGFAAYGAHQAGLLRRQAHEAQRFGQYRIARRLGSGGMGEVYLAEHLLLKRPSVVKVVRADRARDPAVLRRFEREVRILATLTHWNTVAVFDYGHTTDGTFYYAMEYLPGLDLEKLVARFGPLPPGRAVHLLRQLCAALREAHAVGLIHRDVKPGNVMVCRRGGVPDVAKLLDFGLVHAVETVAGCGKLTVEGTVMGTPHYMSPEQAAGKPTDPRSDVYSLGATAYFLLCGKPPFSAASAMEVIAAHMLRDAVPPASVSPDVPLDVSAAVMRCLAKPPEERFACVAELDAALAACGCAAEWHHEAAERWWETHQV